MNFNDKIKAVNHIAGNVRTGDWRDLQKQLQMFVNEQKELHKAFLNRDVNELRDVLADLQVFLIGAQVRLGCPAAGDQDNNDVADALLTRFDRNMADALLTQQKYINKGMVTEIRETTSGGVTYYANISAIDQVDQTNGEFFKAGKFLKSYQFREPVLAPLSALDMENLEATADLVEGGIGLEALFPS